ncbi:Por secretion system C-terminal sorting domain-containing protein [Dyadobacter soli]|uniref:Por secretion system C-terminal sorting domain-containing protein n=1 Tax=Dyadobacter soli TaxID=659014 RepID=A0A1G7VHY4_9BACT|nr:LamG-like jellyroll fold domain-containing protein [Dyadobacter soli]SDG59161.1 Por secretion system C-terminal sorting domain-containing protein [Dyadobacter soli]
MTGNRIAAGLQRLFLIFGVALAIGGAAAAQDITTGLEVNYQFDYETGDVRIADHSGNGRHIAPVRFGAARAFDANFQWGADSMGGQLRRFVHFPAGRDGDVVLSNAAGNAWAGVAGSQARTFSAWVKIDPGANDYAGQILYAYGNDNQPGGRFEIDLKGHAIEFENAANTAGNGWKNRNVLNISDSEYPQGEWFHLALVYDGAGNRKTGIALYLNGRKVAFPVVADDSDLSINTFLQYAPEIGTYMNRMSVADLRVYSRALTAADIRVLCPDNTAPGDLFTIAHLNQLIKTAIAEGASEVVIPPGIYRGTTQENGFIYLQNVSDFRIIADSVTMICEKKTRAFELSNCKNVTVRGLTIDYDPLTFTQGDIVAVGAGYVDVKIHAGYDVVPYSRIDIIDPLTRHRKRGSIFVWGSTASVIGADIVRVSQPDLPGVAVVGDLASMSTGADDGIPHAVQLMNCRGGIKLIHMNVYSAPGFGLIEVGGEGGTELTGFKVVPGPKPAGATQARLLSSSWDAIQHKLTRRGPVVENCVVEAAGDDSWSVTWDGAYNIKAVNGTFIQVSPDNLVVGDSLRTSLGSQVVYIIGKTDSTLQLNTISPWPVGTKLYSPDRRCENFVLRNNHFYSSGRVLVKAGNGLIEGNTFEQAHSGVTVNTEIAPGATGISHLIIRNNIIKGTGHFMPAPWSNQVGAISIADGNGSVLSPAGAFKNILIEKNQFDDISGANILVSSSEEVVIKENIFKNTGMSTPNPTGQAYGINQQAVVVLENAAHVTLDSNEVVNQGLTLLKDITNVTGLTELRGGIFIRNNTLPVTLAAFRAALDIETGSKIVKLFWQTTAETNSDRFEIQHSTDARHWNALGTMNAQGESAAVQDYRFDHQMVPSGSHYYRLKMLDRDGSFAYSSVRNVQINGKAHAISPNPASDLLSIDMEPGSIKQVRIYSQAGKLCLETSRKSDGTVDIRKLPAGMYTICITDVSGRTTTQKLAIAR